MTAFAVLFAIVLAGFIVLGAFFLYRHGGSSKFTCTIHFNLSVYSSFSIRLLWLRVVRFRLQILVNFYRAMIRRARLCWFVSSSVLLWPFSFTFPIPVWIGWFPVCTSGSEIICHYLPFKHQWLDFSPSLFLSSRCILWTESDDGKFFSFS